MQNLIPYKSIYRLASQHDIYPLYIYLRTDISNCLPYRIGTPLPKLLVANRV